MIGSLRKIIGMPLAPPSEYHWQMFIRIFWGDPLLKTKNLLVVSVTLGKTHTFLASSLKKQEFKPIANTADLKKTPNFPNRNSNVLSLFVCFLASGRLKLALYLRVQSSPVTFIGWLPLPLFMNWQLLWAEICWYGFWIYPPQAETVTTSTCFA